MDPLCSDRTCNQTFKFQLALQLQNQNKNDNITKEDGNKCLQKVNKRWKSFSLSNWIGSICDQEAARNIMEVLLSINHDVNLHETTRRDRRLLTDETGDLDFESDLRKFQQTKPSQYQEPLRAFPKI